MSLGDLKGSRFRTVNPENRAQNDFLIDARSTLSSHLDQTRGHALVWMPQGEERKGSRSRLGQPACPLQVVMGMERHGTGPGPGPIPYRTVPGRVGPGGIRNGVPGHSSLTYRPVPLTMYM
jgi:hypothetical protein